MSGAPASGPFWKVVLSSANLCGGGSKPNRRGLQIAFCASSLAIASFGKGAWLTQSQPSASAPPIFRSERDEVEVVVIVRDGSGQPVSDLKQSDFEIRDNGKLQTISGFAIQGARHPTPAALS